MMSRSPPGPNRTSSSRSEIAARRVAVVGSGISGLSAAWHLSSEALADKVDVTLYEAASWFGGHAHTVDVTLPSLRGGQVTHGVDTGFLVFNERTYPGLIDLFAQLKVRTAVSDMSFSVQAPSLRAHSTQGIGRRLEWSGSSLNTVFAQRSNMVSPAFWSMLRQIMRFNRRATELAGHGDADEALTRVSLRQFLDVERFDADFRDGYLLPMIGCIWSCPVEQMLEFPVGALVRFCDNHGLLQVRRRPRWFTVEGGSKHYVHAMLERLRDARLNCPVEKIVRDARGVHVHTRDAVEHFDAVVVATHAPQALAVLGSGATREERALLGTIRTQSNHAVLHTDASLMPSRRMAWAAWNYEREGLDGSHARNRVCLHYWINRLQPLPFSSDVFVSLNPCRPPKPSTVIDTFDYAHPVFDLGALAAQRRLPMIQGLQRTWFAGAWCGHGFHEDGFRAGQRAAAGVVDALFDATLARQAA
jgi:uncharacterized protein